MNGAERAAKRALDRQLWNGDHYADTRARDITRQMIRAMVRAAAKRDFSAKKRAHAKNKGGMAAVQCESA